MAPNDGVLPYDLNTPLHSDYSHKARFVWMPKGSTARYNEDGILDFPIGAVLIKNFFYVLDETKPNSARKLIETRIIINRGTEWEALGYIWNDDQSDAKYEVIGAITAIEWVNRDGELMKTNYIIPNKNQCKNCHSFDGKLQAIGPKASNLNKDFSYVDGNANQLNKWATQFYLSEFDSSKTAPKMAVWDNSDRYTLHDRAMAYLDVNCGHCHNPKGAANTSGLTLTVESEIGTALGVYKPTVSAGAGTGGHTYSIVPGHPEESIMIYRMLSNNPGAMMPELGRTLVHKEGVALIAQWIKEMKLDESKRKKSSSVLQ